MHLPDNWVVIKIKGDDPHYRVLAGWSGGYAQGDSWKLNSGIVKADDTDQHWLFYGNSGSVYHCHKDAYGLRMNNAHVWGNIKNLHGDKVEMMTEDTNWMNMDWIIR